MDRNLGYVRGLDQERGRSYNRDGATARRRDGQALDDVSHGFRSAHAPYVVPALSSRRRDWIASPHDPLHQRLQRRRRAGGRRRARARRQSAPIPSHDGPCLAGPEPRRVARRRGHASSRRRTTSRSEEVLRDFEARDAAIDEAARRRRGRAVVRARPVRSAQSDLAARWRSPRQGRRYDRVRLVVIGEHPEVSPFHGLGQLSPAQLMALAPGRRTAVTRCASPRRVRRGRMCVQPTRAPWPVARRRGETAPGRGCPAHCAVWSKSCRRWPDGLSRTERQGLEAIGDGAATLGEAFVGVRRARGASLPRGLRASTRPCGGCTTAATPLIAASPAARRSASTR